MFDFAWTEIALIAVVALIAIGPKDMPVAIRAVSSAVKKARRMAGEFQTHVDEMVREANLDEVKASFSDLRSFNIRDQITKHVDPDGALRQTFASNPIMTSTRTLPEADEAVADRPIYGAAPAAEDEPAHGPAPAFIPPRFAAAPQRPAFIPPQTPMPRL